MDTTPAASAAAWDAEYREGGIPSSHRDEPSGVVRWTLANLPFLGLKSGRALDVGCGKGRNTREVARAGFETTYDLGKLIEIGAWSSDLLGKKTASSLGRAGVFPVPLSA